MVERSLDTAFHALSDPTRRAMLSALSQGKRTVSELAAPFAMSLAAASKHVKALENAGLVRRDVQGRTHVCRLDATPLAAAHEWLESYHRVWSHRLDALEHALRTSTKNPPTPRKKSAR